MNDQGIDNCPFCGGDSQVGTDDVQFQVQYFIECTKCKSRSGKERNQKRARDRWNRRVDSCSYDCSHCHEEE